MRNSVIVPPYLKQGDTIGIICPSGYMPLEKTATCIETLQNWGFSVKIGKTVGKQFHYFSGTDEERLCDLQSMLDDDGVKAILCARGGYGLSRIIDAVDFTKFRKKPKWVIGYSDITVLQNHLLSRFRIASLHAPMASAFNDGGANNEFVQSILTAITRPRYQYSADVNIFNRVGLGKGPLVGGNLSLIVHLSGSVSDIKTDGKILFLEDIGEYLYHVDRMLMQLKRCGKLAKLAGLIIGGFTEMKDTTIPFGQSVYEIILDKVKEYSFPVCFGFPISHTEKNYAVKIGIDHEFCVENDRVSLKEQE